MVPLTVEDSIVSSGTDVGRGTIIVYSLVAKLGIFTTPGTKPLRLCFHWSVQLI